ncbi:MAG: hypothetical protein ACT4NL_10200 [Pseudomarimonas sp.]
MAFPLHAIAAEPLPAPLMEISNGLGNNDLDAAIDAAESAQDALPDDARTWFWSGRAYGMQAMQANILMKMKWAGRSLEAYEKAVAMDPNLAEARYDLMQYYLVAPGIAGGDRAKANEQAAELARQDLVWGKLATAALANADQKPEAAEAALREAVAAAPDSLRARLALSGMLQRRERWDDVREVWQSRLDQSADVAMARYQLGRASALSGTQLEAGLSQLDAFLAAGEYPDNVSVGVAQWRRGLVLEKLGRREEAIQALNIAVSDPLARAEAEGDLERIVEGS